MTDPTAPSAAAEPASRVRHVVLAGLCLAAAIAYVQRNCIGVLESTMRDDLGLSKDQMGWVMGSFFLTYALFQVPSGWLADRWGSRVTLPLYCILWSVATACVGCTLAAGPPLAWLWSDSADSGSSQIVTGVFAWLMLTRLLAGAAQAGIFPCSAIIIGNWIPVTGRGLATGWLAAFQQVGAVIASLATGVLLGWLAGSWSFVFVIYSLPGVIWAAWFYVWYRDRPERHPAVTAGELAVIADGRREPARSQSSHATPWLAIFSSPAMWWICSQQFFRAFGYIFYASWFPTFLQETRGVSVAASGYLTTVPLAATLAGALIGGYVSDSILRRTGSRRFARQGVASVSLLACAGCIFWAYFVQDATWAVVVIGIGSFGAALAGPAGYTLTIEMAGSHVATVFALMNMSGNIAAFLFPVLVPYLLRLPGNWDLVLFSFGGVYLAAAASWLVLKPEGTIFDQSLWRRELAE